MLSRGFLNLLLEVSKGRLIGLSVAVRCLTNIKSHVLIRTVLKNKEKRMSLKRMNLFSVIVQKLIGLTHEFSREASIKVSVRHQETVNRVVRYISAQFNVTTSVYMDGDWIYLRVIIKKTHYH